MCGILGYVGDRPVVDLLVRGLKRLEYRGYDSSGIGYVDGDRIRILKSEGRIEKLESLVRSLEAPQANSAQTSRCGIGHTRWATHGKPTTQNAHPHQVGSVVLVHNGIIENYQSIKQKILSQGHQPRSETDSELLGFLIQDEMEAGHSLAESVRRSFALVEGACSVVVLSEKEPGTIVGVRNGSPLVAGYQAAQHSAVLASDPQALLEFTSEVLFLEHGDLVVATQSGLKILGLSDGKPRNRTFTPIEGSLEDLDKQGFDHYMLKEIHEEPSALIQTFNSMADRSHAVPFSLADQPGLKLLEQARDFHLVACGTAWHAALLAKYWIEQWAGVPVSVELASEFRHRQPVFREGSVVLGISQSGETADTLAAIREARRRGIPTLGLTNVRGSTLSREADHIFYTAAGPEIGVAATKTLLAQMMALIQMAGFLAIKRKQPGVERLHEDLLRTPHRISDYLESGLKDEVKRVARLLAESRGFFFIGRGYSFPVALEAALKLKEIAYVHAEGYAAGELKHGPIAMIDPKMTVIVLAPPDRWRDKTVSNLEEVKARGAKVLGIGDPQDSALRALCPHWISLPPQIQSMEESLFPFFLSPAIHLLSYELAVLKGTDVDRPRNLAKSVTVE